MLALGVLLDVVVEGVVLGSPEWVSMIDRGSMRGTASAEDHDDDREASASRTADDHVAANFRTSGVAAEPFRDTAGKQQLVEEDRRTAEVDHPASEVGRREDASVFVDAEGRLLSETKKSVRRSGTSSRSLKYKLHLLEKEKAVCVDGSPAGYYYAAGSQRKKGPVVWIIWLEGGGQCRSRRSCEKRCVSENGGFNIAESRCSSKKWGKTFRGYGLMAKLGDSGGGSSESYLARAHHKVFIRYCTSDAHMGRGTTEGPRGLRFNFRGQTVVQQVISDLVDKHGLGKSAKRTRIVDMFTRSSEERNS